MYLLKYNPTERTVTQVEPGEYYGADPSCKYFYSEGMRVEVPFLGEDGIFGAIAWQHPDYVSPPPLKPDPLLTRIRRAPAIYRAYRSLGRPWWKAVQRTIQTVLG